MNCKTTKVALTILTVLVLASSSVGRAANIDPKCEKLPHEYLGPFVNLEDGRILGVSTTEVLISKDEGKTWDTHPLFKDPDKYEAWRGGGLIRTKSGVIVYVFTNRKAAHHGRWDPYDKEAIAEYYLPTCVTRSFDEGATWETPREIQGGWNGAMRCIIQLKSGRLVANGQAIAPNPGRHVVFTLYSDDDGKTWRRSNVVDLGSAGGDHEGTMEATMAELSDGRVYMLVRTIWGWFWETFSSDGGATWLAAHRSNILATSSPGTLLTLKDGQLLLVYNKHRGKELVYNKECMNSIYRGELAVSFSKDDAQTWTKPKVIATGYSCYPYVFERRPGELWITAAPGKVYVRLRQSDFLEPK